MLQQGGRVAWSARFMGNQRIGIGRGALRDLRRGPRKVRWRWWLCRGLQPLPLPERHRKDTEARYQRRKRRRLRGQRHDLPHADCVCERKPDQVPLLRGGGCGQLQDLPQGDHADCVWDRKPDQGSLLRGGGGGGGAHVTAQKRESKLLQGLAALLATPDDEENDEDKALRDQIQKICQTKARARNKTRKKAAKMASARSHSRRRASRSRRFKLGGPALAKRLKILEVGIACGTGSPM